MNNKYLKTDVEGLMKDPKSQAVLNVDNERLAAYKKQKAHMQRTIDQSKRLEDVEQRLDNIHLMLSTILEKITK